MRASAKLSYFAMATSILLLAGQQKVHATNEEGPPVLVSGAVHYLMEESHGKVGLGLVPYAQVFFLHRSDPHFKEWFKLLAEAAQKKQNVKCKIREYSGRIIGVEKIAAE